MKTPPTTLAILIKDLQLVYNKARQAAITQEILKSSAALPRFKNGSNIQRNQR